MTDSFLHTRYYFIVVILIKITWSQIGHDDFVVVNINRNKILLYACVNLIQFYIRKIKFPT